MWEAYWFCWHVTFACKGSESKESTTFENASLVPMLGCVEVCLLKFVNSHNTQTISFATFEEAIWKRLTDSKVYWLTKVFYWRYIFYLIFFLLSSEQEVLRKRFITWLLLSFWDQHRWKWIIRYPLLISSPQAAVSLKCMEYELKCKMFSKEPLRSSSGDGWTW